MAPDFWEEEDKVRTEENDMLVAPFSEEEMKEAIFSCYPKGAPGPDGIPFMFYQRFWPLVVSKDIIAMFNDFYSGKLDLYRLNFALVALIPKS